MTPDSIVLERLAELNSEVCKAYQAEVLTIRAGIREGLDVAVREELERLRDVSSLPVEKSRLAVVIETNGGYVEVVQRIYSAIRHHFGHVTFIVPSHAYSAGTVLVLSGDEIHMDYFSVLGPIDPQYQAEDGNFVPGLGYLEKFETLRELINEREHAAQQGMGHPPVAEMQYLISRFDPAKLFLLEQAKQHGVELLKEWLPRHKFKTWKKTSGGVTVTDEMRAARAAEIADLLGNPKRWHSHSRGVTMRELASEEIKLQIDDFGADPVKDRAIRSYYQLLLDYCRVRGVAEVVHTRLNLRSVP